MTASSRTLNLSRQPWAFFAALALLAALGARLLFYSTPFGLGLNDDAIAYIAGARSILNGDGYREIWIVSAGPVTHFPPGFPGGLTLVGFVTGLDPLRGARLLNGLLFGLNTFLMGWLALRMTGSRLAGLLTALLFLLTASLLRVHSNAMSEPLFIFFTLVTFLLLDLYFAGLPSRKEERGKSLLILVAAGCVIGLAYLTRYAALALLATGLAALFILHGDMRTRLMSSAMLIAGALPWVVAWAIRNRLVGGELTNRALGWHPITGDNIRTGIRTFSTLIVPVDGWQSSLLRVDGLLETIALLLGAGLLYWVLRTSLPRLLRPADNMPKPEVISLLNGLYAFGYFLALVATMTFFDPATRFQLRILAPIFVSLLLLLAYGLHRLASRDAGRVAVIGLTALLITVSAMGQVETVQVLRRGGQIYANERWYDAKAIAALRTLPADVAIHTNQPGVVYLYVGRPASLLPEREPGIMALQQEVLAGEAVIALFKSVEMDEAMLAYYDRLGRGLHEEKYDGDVIYSAPAQ
jgi:4-amino-4-deoxy-L-arabinose transferase-like glycosyltransferase